MNKLLQIFEGQKSSVKIANSSLNYRYGLIRKSMQLNLNDKNQMLVLRQTRSQIHFLIYQARGRNN